MEMVKRYMVDNHLTHTDEWLEACCRWALENDAHISGDRLRQEVLDQWLDAHLPEMESKCLPSNLSAQKRCCLSSKYGLQMNCMLDIGESAYSQWNRLQRLENENVAVSAEGPSTDEAWKPKARRCLYLTLTDGSQEVFAMEREPVPQLSHKLKPGTKLLITGPVECRRGILQLKASHVKVLGGEVDALQETHSHVALLKQILNDPPGNPNVSDDVAMQYFPSQPSFSQGSSSNTSVRPSSVTSFSNATTQQNLTTASDEDPFPDDDDDDELFLGIDESLFNTGAQPSGSATTSSRARGRGRPRGSGRSATTTQRGNKDNGSGRGKKSKLESRGSKTQMSSGRGTTLVSNTPPVGSYTKPFIPTTGTSVVKPHPANLNSMVTGTFASKTDTGNEPKATSSSCSSSGGEQSGRQLKIDGYMKPMPVFIKPKTPPQASDPSRLLHKNTNISNNDTSSSSSRTLPQSTSFQSSSTSTATPACNQDQTITLDSDDDEMFMDIIEEKMEAEFLKQPDSTKYERLPEEELITSVYFSSASAADAVSDESHVREHTVETKTGVVRPIVNPLGNIGKSSLSPTKGTVVVPIMPFTFIKHLVEDPAVDCDEKYFVKGCITTIVSNIQVVDGQWSLLVIINDGTGYLKTRVCPHFLNSVIGYDPILMKTLKGKKTPEAKKQLNSGMGKLTKTLVHFNGLIELRLESGEVWVLADLQEVGLHHLNVVKQRVAQLKKS